MQKRIIPVVSAVPVAGAWIDVEKLARVEVTSEDQAHVIESALALEAATGWRAAGPGEQIIRLIFDQPRQISRISLVFEEHQDQRTQEFVLRWSAGGDAPYREIVRQQWNFSPPHNNTEIEDYRVDLGGLTVLELNIVPDISRGTASASLKQLRLA